METSNPLRACPPHQAGDKGIKRPRLECTGVAEAGLIVLYRSRASRVHFWIKQHEHTIPPLIQRMRSDEQVVPAHLLEPASTSKERQRLPPKAPHLRGHFVVPVTIVVLVRAEVFVVFHLNPEKAMAAFGVEVFHVDIEGAE